MNNDLFQSQTFFIEYDWLGNKCSCQIEAHSEYEAKMIFKRKFDSYSIINKIQTVAQIADSISDKLMKHVKSQLAS